MDELYKLISRMDETLGRLATTAIGALMTSGAAAVIIKTVSNRRLRSAKARGIQIEGEVSLSGKVLEWADDLREEIAQFRVRLNALEKTEADLRRENTELRARVSFLEHENQSLRAALEEVKNGN